MISKIYNYNWFFIFVIFFLVFIGFMALYSAADSNLDLWAKKQIIRFCFGLILLFIISFINIKFWYDNAYKIFLLSLLLLLGVEIFGIFGFGARRWIRIFNISIQPSELVKVTLIIFLAKYFHNLRFEHIHLLRKLFIPIIAVLLLFILILLQPDLGTSITILLLVSMIFFLAGVKIWKFIVVFLLSLISMPLIWNFILKDYQIKRIISFLNPESDLLGTGYQLHQSQIALGSGGLYGKGFLKGSQSYLNSS